MSLLSFKLQDYHAVGSADLKIDGITVIAGENGSGKSTISRWLYFLINSMVTFDSNCYYSLYGELNLEINKFIRLSTDWRYRDSIYRIERKINLSGDEFIPYLEQLVLSLKESVLQLLQTDVVSTITKSRLLALVGNEEYSINDIDKSALVEGVLIYFEKFVEKYINKYHATQMKVEQKSSADLYESIVNTYHTSDSLPRYFSLLEKNESLFNDDHFIEPYFLNKAIYIDASIPTSDRERPDVDVIGDMTRDLILYPLSKELDSSSRQILLRIQRIIKGSIFLKEDETVYQNRELRYKRIDGLDIPLRSAASGIQSIAYLYRLLECGYLDNETLLLIDEPETHLHPQWVVEYANILVRLHKDLGVKIVVASHSPDMISAIETISRRHEIDGVTRFYQAKQGLDMKYKFEDLGMNISEIFESFNVAFSKMQDYGSNL